MIQINNIDEIIYKLGDLKADAQPQFGSMTPQQMVEHLATTIKASNGKAELTQRTSVEEGERFKAGMVHTDMEFPMGIKNPTIPDGPPVYIFSDLKSAINALKSELVDFEKHFIEHPEATHVHPRLGSLNHNEWLIFHGKHFTHHFKQFGLI
jgi:oxepin-CoA hydrolase/3-oxo-5,6-dehydrosuberyl-CoA semialdehyde dehydrogenase